MCFKGIAKTFENSKYMKPPNESIVSCALKVFSKANTFNACCIHVIKQLRLIFLSFKK